MSGAMFPPNRRGPAAPALVPRAFRKRSGPERRARRRARRIVDALSETRPIRRQRWFPLCIQSVRRTHTRYRDPCAGRISFPKPALPSPRTTAAPRQQARRPRRARLHDHQRENHPSPVQGTQVPAAPPPAVLDRDLPAFGLRIATDDARTFFVRVARKLGAVNVTLGAAGELTAAEAKTKALADCYPFQMAAWTQAPRHHRHLRTPSNAPPPRPLASPPRP